MSLELNKKELHFLHSLIEEYIKSVKKVKTVNFMQKNQVFTMCDDIFLR